jgi:hypothetical protein
VKHGAGGGRDDDDAANTTYDTADGAWQWRWPGNEILVPSDANGAPFFRSSLVGWCRLFYPALLLCGIMRSRTLAARPQWMIGRMTDGPRRHAVSVCRRREEFELFHVRFASLNKLHSCCADIVSSSERRESICPSLRTRTFPNRARNKNENNFRQFGLDGQSVASLLIRFLLQQAAA